MSRPKKAAGCGLDRLTLADTLATERRWRIEFFMSGWLA
jgi:hypothetical protein